MNRVGFIGLGTMGLPMAENLLKHGFTVTVYNRSSEKTKTLLEQGSVVASSPEDMAKSVDVIITMLSADTAVEEIILGDNGIINGCHPGLVVIDCSTIFPATSQRLTQVLAELDVDFLDAPVTGSKPQAEQGALTFMVGGKKSVYEQCQPLFSAMGKKAFYMGESGSGSYTKLANNTLAAINLMAVAESMALASKAKIDLELFLEIVSSGGARSAMAENKGSKILSRDFHPNFSTNLMFKDLNLASRLADTLQFPHPMLAMAKILLQMTIANGYGDEDTSSVIKTYEAWAGVEVLNRDEQL